MRIIDAHAHLGQDCVFDEIFTGEALLEKHRHCGISASIVHPAAHAAPPGGRDSRKVFMMARELKVPVMVHTGNGIPFANPANLIPLAEQYPDVPIIMAHSGMMISTGEIGIVMSHCPNTYADVSWVGGFIVERLTAEFGACRFMFGSDHAENASTEIEKIRASRMTGEDKEWVLGKTAALLFGIS